MTSRELALQIQALTTQLVSQLAVTTVPAGADLQAALTVARSGDTLALAAGSTYVGNFTLPAGVTLTGDGPLAPDRISPSARLPRIFSPNAGPAIAVPWSGCSLIGLEVVGNGGGDLVTLGDGSSAQKSLDQVPYDLLIDRCYLHGDALNGQKRGIALNSANSTIRNSYLSDFKLRGQDSQAIANWNGPGPYRILNNYLGGAGENIIFGGSDPAISGLVATDIVFQGNTVAKQLAWRTQGWQVKNLFELKNARRVLIDGNTFENCWSDAQIGWAILFTPRNQDGGAPWVQLQDVTFSNNIVRHAAGGFSILGTDDTHPSQRTTNLKILNNLVEDIDAVAWGPVGGWGAGRLVQIINAPDGVELAHNTMLAGPNLSTFLTLGGTGQTTGLNVHDNVFSEGDYGIIGDGTGVGHAALDVFAPDAQLTNNLIVQYPNGRNINYGGSGNRYGAADDASGVGVDRSKLPK